VRPDPAPAASAGVVVVGSVGELPAVGVGSLVAVPLGVLLGDGSVLDGAGVLGLGLGVASVPDPVGLAVGVAVGVGVPLGVADAVGLGECSCVVAPPVGRPEVPDPTTVREIVVLPESPDSEDPDSTS
jgi:hypothetical protein